jgi:tetratricopeptide (TPR) repeat protein
MSPAGFGPRGFLFPEDEMRTTVTIALVAMFAVPAAHAQVPTLKGASAEAKRANQHYRTGWEAMRKEAWDDAAREFQAAIDSDEKFALAYYSLGRAEMGLRNFQKAIAAYTACKDMYVRIGGERYTNQLDYQRRLDDRILEYQTAIQQAQQTSAGKASSQSQQLSVRDLQTKLMTLQQARDRNENVTIEASVPFFVPMALGAAYFRTSQFAEAEREYMAAIESNPASGETHNNLAVLYLMTNRIDLAEKEVAKAEETGFKVNPGLKDDILKRKAVR